MIKALIIHLGMSGKLRVFNKKVSPKKHEHWDLNFSDNWTLRYTDIRKFGVLDLTKKNPLEHRLLKDLGPEPLGNSCSPKVLDLGLLIIYVLEDSFWLNLKRQTF